MCKGEEETCTVMDMLKAKQRKRVANFAKNKKKERKKELFQL